MNGHLSYTRFMKNVEWSLVSCKLDNECNILHTHCNTYISAVSTAVNIFSNADDLLFNPFEPGGVKWLHFSCVQGHNGLTHLFNFLTFRYSGAQD